MLTSRRQAICGLSLATAGLASCQTRMGAIRGALQALAQTDRAIMPASLTVPTDFVGIHSHHWPQGKPLSPAPTYPFGAVRSHDYGGVAWNRIHTAPDVFDWSGLDVWVDTHAAAGRTLIYTVYGTPAWTAAMTDRSDDYGVPGAAGPVRESSGLQAFILALVNRYNVRGKRRIQYIEMWNEPHFPSASAPHLRNNSQFWWGTAEQLVSMGRVVAQTAKRADSGLKILSPGFAGIAIGTFSLASPSLADVQESSLYQFLDASDGNGGKGSKWCDGIAFHNYNAPFVGPNIGYINDILRLKGMLRLLGLEKKPILNTEFGFLPPNPFHKLSLPEQASILRRCAALQAALGVQGLYFYSHDDDLVGNPSLHPEIASAIGDVHRMIAGKTLKQVTVLADNTVRIETSQASFVW